MQSLLEGLGYGVVARYEKIRESWRLEDVQVELDILPFAQLWNWKAWRSVSRASKSVWALTMRK